MQGVVELLTAARWLTEATEADPTRGPRRFPHPFALFIPYKLLMLFFFFIYPTTIY
jgi:hypothetical protein